MRAQCAGPEVALGDTAVSNGERAHFSTLLTGARCRCSACGETFNVVSTFDAHRVGGYETRRCLAPAEMSAHGWLRTGAGFWITSRMPSGRLNRAATSGDRTDPATASKGAGIAPVREARRQRDRAKLETAWPVMTRGAA